jgi:hypothetical protein
MCYQWYLDTRALMHEVTEQAWFPHCQQLIKYKFWVKSFASSLQQE